MNRVASFRMIGLSAIVSGLLAVSPASPAAALLIDFEEFGHGDTITSSQGVAITTTNVGGGPSLGVGFNSNLTGTSDQDLQRISPGISGGETGWKSGNLAPDADLGILLIIQENTTGCGDGTCDDPDDEGSRPAGSFEFDFSAVGTFMEVEFDLVDVESATTEMGQVAFYLGDATPANLLGTIDFATFLPGVSYGDNSANHVDPIGVGAAFDRLVFSVGGSGALDNIAPIPEPAAALLFAIGVGITGVAVIRRRRA